MEPRITLITLGVTDIARARAFYCEGLGWKASAASQDGVVFIQLDGLVLSLFSRAHLAEDAGLPAAGSGFSGFALAHNVRERGEVTSVLEQARRAGGTLVKPAQDTFWGGHAGYFADPDNHLWEVAWNPDFPLNDRGELVLPD